MSRIGLVTFPGGVDDSDTARAVRQVGAEPVALWHGAADLRGVSAVILPGGFSYGDYLRTPVMGEIAAAAQRGMPVLGIRDGFQVLCEAGLLPGALTRNESLRFVCRDQWLRVANATTAWTARYEAGAEILVPVKHMDGRYVADPATVRRLEDEGRIVFRYLDNPNGSRGDIAGVTDATGRVVGVMPNPEHAIDALTGPSDDGLGMFLSVLDHLVAA